MGESSSPDLEGPQQASVYPKQVEISSFDAGSGIQ